MAAAKSISELLQEAVGLHRAGDIAQAEALYQKVLRTDQNNPDALNLLATIKQSRGQGAQALTLFERAIAVSPSNAVYLFNRANLLSALNRVGEAEADYRRAVSLRPNYVDAFLNLGALYYKCGNIDMAIAVFRDMTERCSQDARGHYNLGRCLFDQKAYTDAETALQRAVTIQPGYSDALLMLAKAHRNNGHLEDAIATMRELIARDSKAGECHSLLGLWLAEAGKFDEAIASHGKACDLQPDRAEFLFNFGTTYYSAGQLRLAQQMFTRAIQVNPDFAGAHINLGQVLTDLGEYDAAFRAFDAALALQSDSIVANENRAAAVTNKALTLLAAGQYAEGWKVYHARHDHSSLAANKRHFPYPEWTGETLAGKTLLLWTEQGLGDEIIYASMIPDVAAGAGRIVLECESRLVNLFTRSFPNYEIVPRANPPSPRIAQFAPDFHIAIPDLGGQVRTTAAQFPKHKGYLQTDPVLVESYKRKYRALSDGRPVVGISWRSASPTAGINKSMPLQHWLPLLKDSDALFVSLQYGDAQTEIADFEKETGVRIVYDDSVDAMKDLDTFAAQVAAQDIVISVSNTTVHFAGALNIPVWTMIPFGKGAMWYFRRGDTTLWYPSMRVYRQAEPGQWAPIIADVSAQYSAWRKEFNRS